MSALVLAGAGILYLATRPHHVAAVNERLEKLPNLDIPPINR